MTIVGSRVTLAAIAILLLSYSQQIHAKKVQTLDNFQIHRRIFDLQYHLPGKEFHKFTTETIDPILKIVAPFGSKDDIIKIERYVADRYPFTSVIGINWHTPFRKDFFNIDPAILKKDRIIPIEISNRHYANGGLIFRMRQHAHGRWYLKWYVYFGNDYQSAMIAVIFPETKKTTVGELLHRNILHGNFKQ